MRPDIIDEQRRQINHRAGWLVADYINDSPRAITAELVSSIVDNPEKKEEELIFSSLISGFAGLNPENDEDDREIDEKYLAQGVKRLDASDYTDNPYYRNIKIEEASHGDWTLSWQEYEPYEAFVRDDLILDEEGREIPAVGYFKERFRFPSVLQGSREWMSIKPSEITTSQAAVDAAHGNVVTFGLGMGYFVYMALLKPDVSHVTVVELDKNVIDLFNQYILPQFPRRNDVTIINSDAFEYLDKGMNADFVFMDIWHDIADGTSLYIKAKQYEARYPDTRFTYWAERSLRCALADYLYTLL